MTVRKLSCGCEVWNSYTKKECKKHKEMCHWGSCTKVAIKDKFYCEVHKKLLADFNYEGEGHYKGGV